MVRMGQSIEKWDVSRVTSMPDLFSYTISFKDIISKLNVTIVSDIASMQLLACLWGRKPSMDVVRVKCGWPTWTVCSIRRHHSMMTSQSGMRHASNTWIICFENLYKASSFQQKLCEAAWINSKKANKRLMFKVSLGSISEPVCTIMPRRSGRNRKRSSKTPLKHA